MSTSSLADARAAKGEARRVFERQAKVVGVGITELAGGYGVKVNLGEAPRRGVDLPRSVRGVPVQVEVVGPIRRR